jgi:hypothetical protein
MQATIMPPAPADYGPEDSIQLHLLKLQMPEKKENLEQWFSNCGARPPGGARKA